MAGVASALFLALIATSALANEDVRAEWQRTVEKAKAEAKPIFVIVCAVQRTGLDCPDVANAVPKPAMRRRLAGFAVLFRPTDDLSEHGLHMYSPAGKRVMYWQGVPDLRRLLKAVTIAEGAAPHLIDWWRAEEQRDQPAALRSEMHLRFALGDAVGGGDLLDRMKASTTENRELARVWRLRLDEKPFSAESNAFLRFAEGSGATPLVRYEASMLMGDRYSREGSYDEARAAYLNAAGVGPEGLRDLARSAIQRIDSEITPVVGLGRADSMTFGRRTIQPRKTHPETGNIEYRIDGRVAGSSKLAPFLTSVNFGRIPSRQSLEIIERSTAGHVLQRTRVIVNERADAFDVDIVEPIAKEISGVVPVRVVTQVPRDSLIESVAIEWNGNLLRRFTSFPYETTLNIQPGEQGILRASLRLTDGSTVEDVRLVNSSHGALDSGTHLIEVPVYAERRNQLDRIQVREESIKRSVETIIDPGDTPLRVALLLDTSSSMAEWILDVQEAALRFVEGNLSARDRVMVGRFDIRPRVSAPTSDRATIEKEILGLRVEGATAMNDAIVTSLIQLQSTGARRALIVFTDGIDNSSVFSVDDVTEVARRSGTPIYVIYAKPAFDWAARFGRQATEVPAQVKEMRHARDNLMKIAESTGGKLFALERDSDVNEVWMKVAADLRRQFLVIYRTESVISEWRRLQVTGKDGRRLRAPLGVHVSGGAGVRR